MREVGFAAAVAILVLGAAGCLSTPAQSSGAVSPRPVQEDGRRFDTPLSQESATASSGASVQPSEVPSSSGSTSTGAEVEPSEECLVGMSAAADEPDPDAAEPLLEETLYSCLTADEWLSALREFPGAMGLVDGAEVGVLELQSACIYRESTVCLDAAERGML